VEVAETIESVRNLVRAAGRQGDCDFVVVSIFVNPTQFGPGEDIENYPRPFEADLEICREAGVAPQQMYPAENLSWVTVEKLTEPLCGRGRPVHFRGVTSVCTKLFNIVVPDVAYFGQKDAQQAIVVRRMVADLNMSLEIVVCPTVREPNGLAVSSRNQYLSEQQKTDATNIYKSLQTCRRMIDAGVSEGWQIIAEMRKMLQQVPSIEIEYVSIVDAETLESVDEIAGTVLVAVAVKIGPARLIDNILVDADK
jgi:pantoate--beta-alanine ligase